MTSLRNSIHRRNHKERSQLAHRAKLGFLEKHKDYVKRAKDYHSKQDRLTRLRQKAAERNKDEFYFSMTKEKTKRGIHVKDRGNVALPTDVVKVLKTQDENYIRTMRVAGLKKIDKIKAQLTALADLVLAKDPEENSLDAEELEILQDAGIISDKFSKHSQRHIVFVEDQVVPMSSMKIPTPNRQI
ncbi:u3 small nucleolar rna-associated protein 11 [Lentinula edodes]|uniref:U3 small nucleolar rna-associated protein 11 n=1 Tax=Lentinula edodes TaxID=5353 RepID=A0A1Q3EIP1_LENED|nr:u3 small nucleolar rna-associated protein 11 [Lentinula edodes]